MFRVIIPLIVGHLIMQRCPTPDKSNEPIANSIRYAMWPILLLAMGFAWNLSSVDGAPISVDIMYGLTLATVAFWMNTQFCAQKHDQAKMLILLLAIMVAVLVWMSSNYSVFGSVMLSIVLIWLLFAEQLQIPKIRIKLPSISVKLPQVSLNGGDRIVSVE
jgi:chromate transport protein ChrA